MFKQKSYGICLYKIEGKKAKILLCRSTSSVDKWGFLKGSSLKHESAKRCAQREFFEESSIFVHMNDFENYYEQRNSTKDIGVWLVNFKSVRNKKEFFCKNCLKSIYLCDENSAVKFFDIEKLPKIKSKQQKLINEIKNNLRKMTE